jgi:DNA-dependent RNA polymerase auxiliary subunit epsilon
MDINAKITSIKYKPLLCRELKEYKFDDLDMALSTAATFILNVNESNKVEVSWWERSRSYPYARVYDSLQSSGKKITIIPIYKDEGKDGDRDFLQWDTISFMSLLGVYTIIGYYYEADVNSNYDNKITNQRYNVEYIKEQIEKLLSYRSDALHWNVLQVNNIGEIGAEALKSYNLISEKTGVGMHSEKSAEKRIEILKQSKDVFMEHSRDLAKRAQKREGITTQPKENVNGTKGTITITNYLGGHYYFTADEVELINDDIYLIEAKHTKNDRLPSVADIKDGLFKMILFTNLEFVEVEGKIYNPIPVLKITNGNGAPFESMMPNDIKRLELLKCEAETNNFKILFNDVYLD